MKNRSTLAGILFIAGFAVLLVPFAEADEDGGGRHINLRAVLRI